MEIYVVEFCVHGRVRVSGIGHLTEDEAKIHMDEIMQDERVIWAKCSKVTVR